MGKSIDEEFFLLEFFCFYSLGQKCVASSNAWGDAPQDDQEKTKKKKKELDAPSSTPEMRLQNFVNHHFFVTHANVYGVLVKLDFLLCLKMRLYNVCRMLPLGAYVCAYFLIHIANMIF